uniref:Coat protein n=1 Tax=Geladintestivirus 1 TaxID=3233133 RepID=A0AAU8MK42_9CAUD
MKQLFITTVADMAASLAAIKQGQLLISYLEGNTKSITATTPLTKDFEIFLGRGSNLLPLHVPEVNLATLKVSKGTNGTGNPFSATIEMPEVVTGADYTLIFTLKGTVFNERSNWTVTERATPKDTSETVAKRIAKYITDNPNLKLKAEVESSTITITALSADVDYAITQADAMDTEIDITPAVKSYLSAENIKDLALQCAANKGFKYLAEDGKEIYPGFPESVPDAEYVLYTLRFAVPRANGKQRDEVVWQLVHIAVPATSTNLIGKLDGMFKDVMINVKPA